MMARPPRRLPARSRSFASAKAGRRSALLPFVLCLALGYLIYFELGSAPTLLRADPADPPSPERIAALPDRPVFAMPPIESFSEIAARPLFSESRRPPGPAAEPEPEPETKPGKAAAVVVRRGLFVLVGVVITARTRLAIVRQRTAREAVRLVEGQQIEGWTVDSIQPDRVLFRQGAAVEEVRLDDSIAPPPPRRPKRRTPKERPERRTFGVPEPDERAESTERTERAERP